MQQTKMVAIFALKTIRALFARWYLTIPLLVVPVVFISIKMADLEQTRAAYAQRLNTFIHPAIKESVEAQVTLLNQEIFIWTIVMLAQPVIAIALIKLYDGYKRSRPSRKPTKTSKKLQRNLADTGAHVAQQQQAVADAKVKETHGHLDLSCDCPETSEVNSIRWSYTFDQAGEPVAILVAKEDLERLPGFSISMLKLALHHAGATHVWLHWTDGTEGIVVDPVAGAIAFRVPPMKEQKTSKR